MLTIELLCEHPPHKCRCRHNVQTEIQREDLTANLIKHNPALLKYLGKRGTPVISQPQINVKGPQGTQSVGSVDPNYRYRSIVEEKGLNYCLDKEENVPQHTPKAQSPLKLVQQDEPKDQPQQQKNIPNISTRPPPKSKEGQQVYKFHKDLRQQSRYLSDTAFRKYFNRQCFQNYGRNNVTGKADGFVYGNYMKTHNINPHTGQNIPMNEETFYHALVTGSPEKFAKYQQQSRLEVRKVIKEEEKSLEKSRLNVDQMLKDNHKHSEVAKKYDHLHIKPKEQTLVRSPKGTSEKYFKGPSQLELNTKKHFNHQSQANMQRAMKVSHTAQLNPNAQSLLVHEPTPVKQHNNKPSNISINQALRVQESKSPKHGQLKSEVQTPKSLVCSHKDNQSIECECCINKMKGMILELADKDPGLAERIITSAQKQVRYKNFALNNYQNATKNPHNFRSSDGRLNIYQSDN